MCNVNTNYPCAKDEACRLEEPESQYSCKKCIIPELAGPCPVDIPMVCSDGCEYPNECLARKAGYNPTSDCRHSNAFVPGPGGNLYKAFEKRAISWTEAWNAVQTLADECLTSIHLATITSLEEDVFVHELARALHAYYNPKSFWVGGFQNVDSPDFKEPDGGWEWVSEEWLGSLTTRPISGGYENWGPKEPNDFRRQPQNPENLPENHMTIGRFDKNSNDEGKATGWNDEFPGPFVRGYIVEVEVKPTVEVLLCDSKVANLRLPPKSKECPPGQISSLIQGCVSYNHPGPFPEEFNECVTHIANELEFAGLITGKERDDIVRCTTPI